VENRFPRTWSKRSTAVISPMIGYLSVPVAYHYSR
jgi:hypothetical protein